MVERAKQDRREGENVGSELSVVLKQHQEEIATAWAEMIESLPDSPYADLPPEQVASLTLRGVEVMAECLETGSTEVMDEYLSGICVTQGEGTPNSPAAIEALLLCKETAMLIIRDVCGRDSSEAWDFVSQMDACLRAMVGRLTSLCTAEMPQQLQEERARVEALLEMAQTVGSTLDLDDVVSRAAEQIVAMLGVDRCVFHLVDETKRRVVRLLEPFHRSSRALASLDSFTDAFHEVLAVGEPLASYDALSDPRFPRERLTDLGVKSTLGVPLKVRGKVIAVAWAYTEHHHCHFGSDEIKLAQGIGNMLGVIIQNAQLYEQSKLLALTQERARLSREIHDGLAQTLGALQLKASQLEDSFPSQHIDEPRHHLTELQEMISRAYRDLREAMFSLRAVVEPGTALAPALQEYLRHYRAHYDLDVRLEVSEGEPVILDGETQAHAMRVVQEALSNVRRHSGTDRATVSIEREGNCLRICVVDEGRGFDLGTFEGKEDAQHLGLRIMRERAESVGGRVVVQSRPGQGTRTVLEFQGLLTGS